MIKSTAVVLGFLFGLSTIYYLSFWSFFDIDVFQYIAVEDIIKGIAYPLRFAGIYVVALFLFIFFVLVLAGVTDEKEFPEEGRGLLKIFIPLTLLVAIVYFFLNKYTSVGMAFSIILSFLLAIFYFSVDSIHEKGKEEAIKRKKQFTGVHLATEFFNRFLIYLIIFLPINSLIAGQVDARAIHAGRKYNYILSRDLPKDKIHTAQSYLIFLGAVSEKYIFIDRNEQERFILDKEELQSLQIHHFDSSDPKSVIHLTSCFHIELAKPRK